jgi:hypothetical protein
MVRFLDKEWVMGLNISSFISVALFPFHQEQCKVKKEISDKCINKLMKKDLQFNI